MIKLAHMINPVASAPGSRFYFIQNLTFESMRVANEYSKETQVQLLTAQFPEDHGMLTPIFVPTADLTRSVLDLVNFQIPRKLPILQDILDRGYQERSADYLIYTNVDIGLQPHFYRAVSEFIQQGYDAFVINRRTVSDRYASLDQLDQIYQDSGKAHRGWDCFVFPRKWIPDFLLGTVCIGAPLVGLALLSNLIARTKRFKEFKNEKLTFHLGDDRAWNQKKLADYHQHNFEQLLAQLKNLEDRFGPFPPQSIPARYLAWQSNPLKARVYQFYARYPLPLSLANLLKKGRQS